MGSRDGVAPGRDPRGHTVEWKQMKLKVLWHSNAPAPLSYTGYGVETALFVPRLAKMGYDVVISCMTGVSGFPTEWEGITCLPSGLTTYSSDILAEHARRFFGRDPGLILVHYDAWAVGPDPVQGHACAAWAPVHSDPMSAGDQAFFHLSGSMPIAYSRFGERKMREAGLQPQFVPHGIDPTVFRPLDAAERAEARRRLKVPEDAFMIAMVGANKGTDPPRKGWGEAFQAFARFRRKHPDAVLFCHTLAATIGDFGLDMRPMINQLGIADSVIFSDDYPQVVGLFSDAFVARLTGCADVYLQPSWGEGFGLGALQAQACGVPVIVGDNSAQTELCGAGWLVSCQPYWYWRDQANWACPSIRSIVACLEKSYRARGDAKLADKARRFALAYDADTVAEQYWRPVMGMLEQYAGAARVGSYTTTGVRPGTGTVELPTVEADGLRWLARGPHTDDWISVAHEDALAPVLDTLMPEGGVLLDVGAHVGRWSLRLAGKAAHVIAVEANPDTAAVLRYHLALNKIQNVTVHQVAAWDERTTLRLSDPHEQVTGGSTRTLAVGEGTEVEAVPLDDVLGDRVDRIDLVKLDVEGADLHVLRGMAGTLLALRPMLFIEDHSIYGYYDRRDLLGLLEGLAYEPQVFTAMLAGNRSAPYVIARPAGGGQDPAEAWRQGQP
jgi:FkbM family methyltransferase